MTYNPGKPDELGHCSYGLLTLELAVSRYRSGIRTGCDFARITNSWRKTESEASEERKPFGEGARVCRMGAEGAKEVRLWQDKREREMYDNFADLYAIIRTTEKLEKAYVRDAISPQEYETECSKLIAQFKTLRGSLKDTVQSVERFMETYKMDCPAAANRLLVSGIPATVEHRVASSESGNGGAVAVAVAECVQSFITAMDSLKLNMVAVDQLYPTLTDLYSALTRVPQLPPDFEGKLKVRDWISRLKSMKANDELPDHDSRQLLFDLETSYNAFMDSLPKAAS